MRKLLLQRNILILIGVLIFAVTVFAGARMYRHWTTSYYFGRIVAIQNGGFDIESDERVKATVITGQYTVIKKAGVRCKAFWKSAMMLSSSVRLMRKAA